MTPSIPFFIKTGKNLKLVYQSGKPKIYIFVKLPKIWRFNVDIQL